MSLETFAHPEPEEIIGRLSEEARKTGVDEWEVYLTQGRSLAVAAKEGKIDQVRRSDGLAASLRLIHQGRLGFAYTSVFTPEALADTAARASAGARLTDPQPHLALPGPPDGPYPELDQVDPEFSSLSQQEKMDRVLAMEAAALGMDPRVERVRQAEYSESEFNIWLVNCHGLEYRNSGHLYSAHLMAKAADGDEAEMGAEGDFAWRRKDLDLEAIGRDAASRALAGLGGRKVATGQTGVILDRRTTAVFLDILSSSFLADNVQKGKSSLAGKIGRKIVSSAISLVDDGLYPGGLASSPSDDEGTPSRRTVLIEEGVLKSFLYDLPRARQDGVPSTGNAGRGGAKTPPGVSTTNFILTPGQKSPEELMAELGTGMIVTDVLGAHTADAISGDFSVGVSGFWVSGGEKIHPVKGMALAGNLFTMFGQVAAVGSDLKLYGATGAPSLLIEGLALSGT